MAQRPPGRLRHRLFLIFLAFATIPSLLLSAIAYRSLNASLDLWRTPGVSRALEGSVLVARQVLGERRQALRAELARILSAAPRDPARALLYRPDVDSGPFDAVGVAPARTPTRIRWTSRLGHRAPEALVEKRLAALRPDTLVIAGPDHLGMAAVRGEARWIGLAPIPEEMIGPLADILRAQAFYDELDDYRTVARRSLGLAALATFLFVLLLAWLAASWLALRVTRPLETLAAAMGALSRGEPAAPVAQGEGEVRQLAETFEAMRTDLERSHRDLARAERIAAWREVARRIAHEIKNPLTPIRLAVHRLRGLEGSLGVAGERERLRESLDSVDREVETLRRMADTFSRFSRLPEPDRRRTAVEPVIRSVAEMYEGSALRLEWRVPEDLSAMMDEGQVRQALHNLIQNASDATRGEGPVRVEAVSEARGGRPGIRITVADQGPGFEPDALAHAGEPYFTRKTHGTGLGLSLVRRIADSHGGSLRLANSDGAGAVVEMWFPCGLESEEAGA